MNPLLIPTKLIQYARLTFSSEYAKRTAEAYWRNTTSTHTVMDEAAFHQMFTELSKLIGPVDG